MASDNYRTPALLLTNTASTLGKDYSPLQSNARYPGALLHLNDNSKRTDSRMLMNSHLNESLTSQEDRKTSDSKVKSPVLTKTGVKESSSDSGSPTKEQQGPNSLPSYTAMIAQAILSKDGHKCTLSEIYEYMEKSFPSLERRGTGWRNCVRHTLSLNDCFLKLHRPENGRSCNWAIHPTYFDSFSRGDYRKRRTLRKRPRSLPWLEPGFPYPMPYFRDQDYMPPISHQTHGNYQTHSLPHQPSHHGHQNHQLHQTPSPHQTRSAQSVHLSGQSYNHSSYSSHQTRANHPTPPPSVQQPPSTNWQYSSTSTNSWNNQSNYHSVQHTPAAVPAINNHPVDYRPPFYSHGSHPHSSPCHYMDQNCHCYSGRSPRHTYIP